MLSFSFNLRTRVLLLAAMMAFSALLLGVMYFISAERFDGYIKNFETENTPRFEASYALEDRTYSVLTKVRAFQRAQTLERLQTNYEDILVDVVALERTASNPNIYAGGISELELHRLVEGLKHSLNTTLALKSAAEIATSASQKLLLDQQITVNDAILLQDLTRLRNLAVANRAATMEASAANLAQLEANAERDGRWTFGILTGLLIITGFLAWYTTNRVRIGLQELSSVLLRKQSGFSDQFLASRDEFAVIGRKVQRFAQQEKRLNDAQARAAESELKAGAFEVAIANLTHDLRTPASQISGVIGLIADREAEQGPPSKEVQMAKSASRRLLSLIQDVLDLTRVEMSQAEPILKVFNPSDMFEDLISSFQYNAESRGLDLQFDNQMSFGSIEQDDHRIQRVVSNLLDNAIKYTNHGKVVLRASSMTDADGGANLVISVEDTGIGIPKEHLSEIFEKFSRAKNHYAIDGLGLGLALVARFTDMLGGTLAVESEVSKGTTFRVTLPCRPVKNQPSNRTVDENLDSARAEVLLVDDDPFNLALASALLSPVANLTCAQNGQEAVDAVKDRDFDFIVMDWRMPVLDGLEATREIRRLEKQSSKHRTPIWGLTANASAEEKHKAIAIGMDDLFAKPLSHSVVQELVVKSRPSASADPNANADQKIEIAKAPLRLVSNRSSSAG